MNILIIILCIIGGLIALFLIIAFFTKRDIAVEKTILINRPKQEVFDYIKYLKNQEYYSIWVMKDPNIKLVYTGTDGAVGGTSSWSSNDKGVGVGAQEIKQITDGERIYTELRFEKPFKATNYATMTTTNEGAQTKVSMLFTGHSKFPMNFMNLFMDKLIGKDMDKNLHNLKNKLEATN